MPSILCVSEVCLLDVKSGVAHQTRAVLKALAAAGWNVQAITLSLCEGDGEQSLAECFPEVAPGINSGSLVTIDDDTLHHHVLVTGSTLHQSLRPWEMRKFQTHARQLLIDVQPDIVLTYGSQMLQPILAEAQHRGSRTVFSLANPSYAQRSQQNNFVFRYIDDFLVPSAAMADLYRREMGLEAIVLADIVPSLIDGRRNLTPQRITNRKQRVVTMINPEPAKGGLLFLNIVAQAAAMAPEIRFRAVEHRWGKQQWIDHGADIAQLENLEWEPLSNDMTRLYEESALLLVPSVSFEASGRVIAEAMLAGMPVLATEIGGIPAQLNGGGFLFDLPEAMKTDFSALPETAYVQKWTHFIRVLMEDDGIYRQAVQLTLKAAAIHTPERCQQQAVNIFTALLAKPMLANISEDAATRASLSDMRTRMNQLRETVNRSLDQPGQRQASLTTLSREHEPYIDVLSLSLKQPAIRDAMAAVGSGEVERARAIIEQYLRLLPEDISALSLLADVADKQQHEMEARGLMERVIELAPGFMAAHQQLLKYLRHAGDAQAALEQSFALLERSPHQPLYLMLHASLLTAANRFEEAIAVFESCFKRYPGSHHDWMQYALALKTIGRQQAAVDAYRKAISLAPGQGHAWHALSNMKLSVFTDDDIATMQHQLAKESLSEEDKYNIHFTLGKAFEDQKTYQQSFEHYASANRIRHQQHDYDISRLEAFVQQAKELFTGEFFAQRAGCGHLAADPVFVLGLHRAGSTLTEQILASHSQIEGTRELPNMLKIGREFGGLGPDHQERRLNSELLSDLSASEFMQLGQQYLDETRAERNTDRPLFIDKMPANWMYTGLIHLIFPNAKIIDIRRQPMAAGFALFKMNFGKGVEHAYSQEDIARYYIAYADLMAHFDKVLPGRIHHIQYESLVENTESEIRRLIDYCGVGFEQSCLHYWETDRAVQTPSSEQVRRPIYAGAKEQWKNYELWLGAMRDVFESQLKVEPK